MSQKTRNADDVMAVLAEQDMKFPSNSEVGESGAEDVLTNDGDDESGDERIGSLVISTNGSGDTLQVPHTELKRKMREIGFPEGAIPDPVAPRFAFTRAKNDLFSSYNPEASYNGHEVEFDEWSEGRYEKYVVAEFIEDGEAQTVTLGKFFFDPDTESVYYDMNDDIKGTELTAIWGGGFVQTMKERFAHYQTVNTADDIAELQDRLHRKVPSAIKLRRAVYFYPDVTAGLDNVLESYRELYSWLNENYKLRGDPTEFYWTPLFNREQDQEFVTEKLEEHIESEIEDLLDDVTDEITEGGQAEEIARDILQPALSQMDSTVKEYEAISESTPRVRRMIRQNIQDIDGEAGERAERVLEAAQNDELDEDPADTVEYDPSEMG